MPTGLLTKEDKRMETPSLIVVTDKRWDKEKRIKATLTFHRGEILYDCANCAFVEGDIADSTEMEHARHQIQDIAEDGNVDRATRVLNLAHAEVVELLFPFTKNDVDGTEDLDDTKDEPETYTVSLNLPGKFSKTTVNLLLHLIHEYMVCRVLQDWLSITYPKIAGTWAEKVEEARQKIKEAKAARTGRTKRNMSPF